MVLLSKSPLISYIVASASIKLPVYVDVAGIILTEVHSIWLTFWLAFPLMTLGYPILFCVKIVYFFIIFNYICKILQLIICFNIK